MRKTHVRYIYYIITALHDFAFSLIAATYALFLLSHGLTALEMNLVNTVFMLGNIIFEIPTGVYADYFGKRKSIILHGLFLAVSGLFYAVSSNFGFFIIAELIGALSYTFASGALDAWVTDSIGEDWIDRVDYIFSQGQVYGKIASIGGGLIGAYLGAINLAYPFIALSIGAILISILALFGMSEDQPEHTHLDWKDGVNKMKQIAVESAHYGLRNNVVLWLTLSTLIAQFAFQPLNMFWAPRFTNMEGNRIELMGWAWAIMALMMTFGSLINGYLVLKKFSYWKIMVLNALILGLPIIFSSLSSLFPIAASFFFIYEIGRGIDRPMKISYLNKYIPNDKRATLLSFDSTMGRIGAIIGLILFGMLADRTSYAFVWFIAGFFLLFLIPIYYQIKKHENITNYR